MNRRRRSLMLASVLMAPGLIVPGCGDAVAQNDGHNEQDTTPQDEPRPTTLAVHAKWDLWTQGTALRGANIHQRLVYPELDGTEFIGPGPLGPPFVQGDFDALAALGANVVNISHPGLFTETPPYVLDAGVQDNLDALLLMIERADLFATITFRTGPGRAEFSVCCFDESGDWFDASYLNDSVWTASAAQDGWIAMWRYAAERYHDHAIVVGYELMCEPNANEVALDPTGTPLDEWDPEQFYANYGGTAYDWNQLFPRITRAIREVDPDTPLLIGGMAYSAVEWLEFVEPTTDPYTVYTIHPYEPVPYTHQSSPTRSYPGSFDADYDGTTDRVDSDWLDSNLAVVDNFMVRHGTLVAVTEFGVIRWQPGAERYLADHIALFESRGLNHMIWEWSPVWEAVSDIDDFNLRHGSDPQNHEDATSTAALDIVAGFWQRNVIRPSDVEF